MLFARLGGWIGTSSSGKKRSRIRARTGPGFAQPGKLLGQEQPREVGGILLEREALLVAPHAAQELVADQAEGLDGDPALGG